MKKQYTKWYLVPKLIVDRNKYRGRGRPRKSDYRIYPNPDGSDLSEPIFKVSGLRKVKEGWKYKLTARIKPSHFKNMVISYGTAEKSKKTII